STQITNDDPVPSISINDTSVVEGNSPDTTTAVFTVSLSNPSSLPISVDYTTADDTAVAPGDYTAVTTAGTVTIPAGMTTTTISITVIGDETVEANETFFVNLANSTNGTIVDS